jgi:hypothetical protein
MQPSWQNLQGFSGATAVGALTFIGLILVANAFATNLLAAIDFYSRTPTWAIVIAFPAIAVSYLLGLLSMGAAEAMLTWTRAIDAETLVEDHVAVGGRGDHIAGHFRELRQEAAVLAGGSIGLAVLALGAALSAWNEEGWRRLLLSAAVGAIVLALASMALARFRHTMAHRLAAVGTAKAEGPRE